MFEKTFFTLQNPFWRYPIEPPRTTALIKMDHTAASKFLFLFLLSTLIVCSSVFQGEGEKQRLHSSRRKLVIRTIQHDSIDSPITTFPTTPVANPGTIITVPSATPVTVTPTPPSTPTTPITNPTNPPVPITNPVTTPSTNIPGGQPVSNPANPTGGIPVTTPVVAPPVATNGPPSVAGQSWCVMKGGADETTVQAALDYACGIGGVDCSAIQQGSSCYNPNSLQNHASYAFNSYYQRDPLPTSCDFGGVAVLTNANPSSGSCIFTTASSSTSPTTATNPTPTTASSSGATPTGNSGTPPNVLNAGNPPLGGTITGFGDTPPNTNAPSVSMSSSLQPFIGCIIVVMISIITWGFILDI